MSDSVALVPTAPKSIVYLLAKEPTSGFVKTRLTPALTPAQAARAAKAFLEDTLANLATLPGIPAPTVEVPTVEAPAVEVRIATAPDSEGGLDQIQALGRSYGTTVELQGEGDLGARMARLMRRGLADPAANIGGPSSVVLIGADTPDLPAVYVADAFRRLQTHDVVVGPSEDGGYYLIGASRLLPDLFSLDVAWGGPGVFRATLEVCAMTGVSTSVLPPWRDVDEIEDFSALMARLVNDETEPGGVATSKGGGVLGGSVLGASVLGASVLGGRGTRSPAPRSFALGHVLRREGVAL